MSRYDFNCDVETGDRIGCADLIYHAHGLSTGRRTGGRKVIIPDDVAVRALGDGPLAVVSLYSDGERVTGAARQALARLMQQRQ